MTISTDYKHTHFEKPNLTQIRGQPTFETLSQLLREFKTNAQYVHINLVGGMFGHLGLVLSDAQYLHLSPTAFLCPTHPVPLTINIGTTVPMATTLK